MAWVKLDDRYDDTRKIRRAWRANPAAVGLHVMATTHSARHETDGLVDLEWLEGRLGEQDLQRALEVLLREELFELLRAGETRRVKVPRVKKGQTVEIKVAYGPLEEDAYIVHDYLVYNESRGEAEERRRVDAERKTTQRRRPSDPPSGVQTESTRTPDGHDADSERNPSVVLLSRPDPTRPDPTPTRPSFPPGPPRGGRRRDQESYEQDCEAWAADRLPDLDRRAVVGYARTAVAQGVTQDEEIVAYVRRHTGGVAA